MQVVEDHVSNSDPNVPAVARDRSTSSVITQTDDVGTWTASPKLDDLSLMSRRHQRITNVFGTILTLEYLKALGRTGCQRLSRVHGVIPWSAPHPGSGPHWQSLSTPPARSRSASHPASTLPRQSASS